MVTHFCLEPLHTLLKDTCPNNGAVSMKIPLSIPMV